MTPKEIADLEEYKKEQMRWRAVYLEETLEDLDNLHQIASDENNFDMLSFSQKWVQIRIDELSAIKQGYEAWSKWLADRTAERLKNDQTTEL